MDTNKPLTYMIGQTTNLVSMKMKTTLKEKGIEITPEHFVMLYLIDKKQDITQQDLANHFQKDKSIILRHMNTLIELKYVTRMIDKNDKRKKNLILTTLGHDILSSTAEISKEVSEELLEGISNDELKVFEEVIRKIQINTKQTNLFSNC